MATTISATDLNDICRFLGDYAGLLKLKHHSSTRDANRVRIINRLITKLKNKPNEQTPIGK